MNRFPTLLITGLAFATAVCAAEVGGIKLDDRTRITPGGPELVLNGAGVRKRLVFSVYVGALYLPEKKTAAADVLALPGPKRVVITMLRDLSAQQFTEALSEGLRNNSSPAEQEAVKSRMDALFGMMNALKETKKGDVLLLDYLPDSGTQVSVNGQPQGKPIAGEDFQRALLRIWLGDKPADAELKKAMLGG
jgi:hypothetical protein